MKLTLYELYKEHKLNLVDTDNMDNGILQKANTIYS